MINISPLLVFLCLVWSMNAPDYDGIDKIYFQRTDCININNASEEYSQKSKNCSQQRNEADMEEIIPIMTGVYDEISSSLKTLSLKHKEMKNQKLRIITSRNILKPGGKVYFALETMDRDGLRKIVNPQWSAEPSIKGVILDRNGYLYISNPMLLQKEYKIKLVADFKGIKVSKDIRIGKGTGYEHGTRVHYFRYDGAYEGWNIWAWSKDQGKRFNFEEDTDFGKLAVINDEKIIIRFSGHGNEWKFKETEDVSLENVAEVFIIQGENRVYTDFLKALEASRPRIISAIMDDRYRVNAVLSTPADEGIEFALKMNGRVIARSLAKNRDLIFNINKEYNFDPAGTFEIVPSKIFMPQIVQMRSVLDSYYYEGKDLGVTFSGDQIDFRIWAPTASRVSVLIFDKYDEDVSGGKEYNLNRDEKSGVWHVNIGRDNYKKFYLYKIIFREETSFEEVSYTPGPYVKAVAVNGIKGYIIDTINDPDVIFDGWKPGKKPKMGNFTDAVIYELHVRDFSVDKGSGVNPRFKGKYPAFTLRNTSIPNSDNVKTCLEHLIELGITHLHLLPVYDFASVDESKASPGYNWGYDPGNYNVPEGSYSTDPFTPSVRIREFRQMVQSLHDNDIRVVMDVVYNHTYKTILFDSVVPGYYYRTDYQGRYTNGSGCGNEVATERPMVRKFVVDSVRYWADAYNIDGFRFDLMGLIDFETMKQVIEELRKMDPTIMVYGEPWTGGTSALPGELQTSKNNISHIFRQGYEFAAFNDNFRNAIRGDNGVPFPSRAYVTGLFSAKPAITRGALGSIYGIEGDSHDTIITSAPCQTINYAAAHDNYVLWDQVTAAMGHLFPYPYVANRGRSKPRQPVLNDPAVRRAMLANAIVLTSQGIPFLHAGDEILRTKFGDHNSYKSGDSINRIRWEWKKEYQPVFEFHRSMIAFRKTRPSLRLTSREEIERKIGILDSPEGVVAFLIGNPDEIKGWREILIAYNPAERYHHLALPGSGWNVFEPVEGYYMGENTVEGSAAIIPPLSILILHR